MRECGFSVTRILPYKDKIVDLSLYGRIRFTENPYSRIFYAEYCCNEAAQFNELHLILVVVWSVVNRKKFT